MESNLKELREKKNLSQKQLAEIIGISQRQVSLYEKGISYPSRKTALKISKFFNKTVDYIFLTRNTI